MKKHVLLMVACATCMAVSSVCAQITESEDGNVGIKVGMQLLFLPCRLLLLVTVR